jgi:hypothetical protein
MRALAVQAGGYRKAKQRRWFNFDEHRMVKHCRTLASHRARHDHEYSRYHDRGYSDGESETETHCGHCFPFGNKIVPADGNDGVLA